MSSSIQQSNLKLTSDRVEKGGWNIGQLTVATKKLDEEQIPNVPAIRAFMEKKIAKIRLLHHPNLVTVLDVTTFSADQVYIVREYVKGSDLSSFLTSSLSLNDRLLIAQQIASAMAFLHSQNIFHHNLKPSNVLLADNDPKHTKVCDLGFWATAAQNYNASEEGAIWTAPEALSKKPFDADCDIFSFGLILYCLVAKKSSPLKRSAKTEFKFTFNKDDNKDVPEDIWDVVIGCCDQVPSRRPKFSEIEKTLKTYHANAVSAAAASSPSPQKDDREGKKTKKPKEGKEGKETKETRETNESKETKKPKEGKETKETRETNETKETKKENGDEEKVTKKTKKTVVEDEDHGEKKKKRTEEETETKTSSKKPSGDDEVKSPKNLGSSRKKREDKAKDSPSLGRKKEKK